MSPSPSTAANTRQAHNETPDVSRRDWLSLLGTLGLGQLVAGCADPGPAVERLARTAESLTASGDAIDFVADCGADPTGVADCAPALDLAFQKLTHIAAAPRMTNSTTLNIPPGVYRVASTPAIWNFVGLGVAVEVRGWHGASIFVVDGGQPFSILNTPKFTLSNIAFAGTNSVPSVGFAVIYIGAVLNACIQHCRFQGITANHALVYASDAYLSITDTEFSNNSGVLHGTVYALACERLVVQRCAFTDIAKLNTFAFNSHLGQQPCFIKVDRSQPTTSFGQTHGVHIEHCMFDEGARETIRVQADATATVRHVVIRQCIANVPTLPGASSILHIEGVDHLLIDGFVTNIAASDTNIPGIVLNGVGYARIRSFEPSDGTHSRAIVANAATTFLRVEDSPRLAGADIRSAATTTQVAVLTPTGMVETQLGVAAAELFAGALLRIADDGTDRAAYDLATQESGGAIAIAVDAASPNSPFRVALPSQRVSVQSDGSTAIAIGDAVALSSTFAGYVTKATDTSNVVGYALSRAASGTVSALEIIFLGQRSA